MTRNTIPILFGVLALFACFIGTAALADLTIPGDSGWRIAAVAGFAHVCYYTAIACFFEAVDLRRKGVPWTG